MFHPVHLFILGILIPTVIPFLWLKIVGMLGNIRQPNLRVIGDKIIVFYPVHLFILGILILTVIPFLWLKIVEMLGNIRQPNLRY